MVGRRADNKVGLGVGQNFRHSIFGANVELGMGEGQDGIAGLLKNLYYVAAQLSVGANQKHLHRVTSASARKPLFADSNFRVSML